MNIFNSQEASSPAQQGSPASVTQHANNGLDEPVSDSNVSTTNHALAAVEAGEEWVDEGEELEVLCMLPIVQDYHNGYHIRFHVRIWENCLLLYNFIFLNLQTGATLMTNFL
jgi:hypothetical protein